MKKNIILSFLGVILLIGSFPLKMIVDRRAIDICRLVGFILIFVVQGLHLFQTDKSSNSEQHNKVKFNEDVHPVKKGLIWKILLVIGLCPFFAPFIYYLSMHIVHNHYDWTLIDMLFIWSSLYWPTYLIGLVIAAISISRLKK